MNRKGLFWLISILVMIFVVVMSYMLLKGKLEGATLMEINNAGQAEIMQYSEENVANETNVRMVMVDGKLYYDTGRESTITARCGNLDGIIDSFVAENEVPTMDGQANFKLDTSYSGYQIGINENEIEILIDGVWRVFSIK